MKSWGTLLILPTLLWGQPQFYGYFEAEVNGMQVAGQNYTFGFNKFRLDIESRPSDAVLIGANINFQKYWGKTTWNIYDFLPGYSDLDLINNIELQDTVLIDNIYLRVSFPVADLTVGRQQLSPGVGYAWNPTDIFNSKSLLDPSYEQTGVEALRLDIPLGNRSRASAIILPENNLRMSTQQYSLKGALGSFDFNISTAYQVSPDDFTPLLGSLFYKDRRLTGFSGIGEFLGWGLWGEFGYNVLDVHIPLYISSIPEVDDTFIEYVLGVDHTFDNSLYFMFEYLHNGLGVAQKDQITLNDYIMSLSGETNSLMQDYLFGYIMHPSYDYVTLSAITFANLNDGSGALSPIVDWSIYEDTNLSLQGSVFWGEDDTEFGLQDWGLILNITTNF